VQGYRENVSFLVENTLRDYRLEAVAVTALYLHPAARIVLLNSPRMK
jgi:hypothetical protein